MGLYDALLRLLRAFTGASPPDDNDEPDEAPEPPDVPEPVPPLTYRHNDDGTFLDVAIYQTTGLTDRLGRVPEHQVVRFMAQALRDAGYNYIIRFHLDPVNLPDSADTLSDFAAQQRDGEDLNLLLGDRNGGGRAYLGGKYAIGPAGNIERAVQLTETAPAEPDTPRLWINLRASALHEPGHSFGGKHADVMTDPLWGDYPENGAEPSLLWHNVEDGWMTSPAPRAD